jgi:hypothetical protein
MKRVIINRNNGAQYMAEMDDPTLWIQDCIQKNLWGLPERDELDQDGNPTGNKLPAEYTIEIQDVTYEHNLKDCIIKRMSEYPSAEDFLNAYFDGGEEALNQLKSKRLEVKAKYPKPIQG